MKSKGGGGEGGFEKEVGVQQVALIRPVLWR